MQVQLQAFTHRDRQNPSKSSLQQSLRHLHQIQRLVRLLAAQTARCRKPESRVRRQLRAIRAVPVSAASSGVGLLEPSSKPEEIIDAGLVARALGQSKRKLLRDWRRRGKPETRVGRDVLLASRLVLEVYFPHHGNGSRQVALGPSPASPLE